MNKEPGVYAIKCKATGEVYIGSAVNILRRVKEHIRDLNHGAHANGNLQAEWERYTQDGFDFSIIEQIDDKSQIRIREQYWIDTLNPTFNIARIVEQPSLGIKKKPETIEKIRKALKKSHDRMTPEQKAERRRQVSVGWQEWWDALNDEERDAARKRRSHTPSDEVRRILSEKGKANPSRGNLGKHPGAETRRKMREATKARWAITKIERDTKKAAWESGREGREIERRRKIVEAHTGKVLSEATKEKLRQVALAQQQDPAYRAKHAEGLGAAMRTPEMHQKLSDAHKGKTLTEEHKAAIGAATKGRVVSEETKVKMREAQKARHAAQTPERREEIRQAIVSGVSKVIRSEESKQKASESLKKAWAKRKAQK